MFSSIYNKSCLVKYEKYLYKVKLMYKDINPLTNLQDRNENSGEIEEVIRAILNSFVMDTHLPGRILTLNYLIKISVVFWKITETVNFYLNGKKLKCKFYIKLSIYSNCSMHINHMTDNDIDNCKMKQRFPLPSSASAASFPNKYLSNKGPLTDFRNMTVRKKQQQQQLLTNGIDAAFKEHFLNHSSYFREHLSDLNIHSNSTAVTKSGPYCGNGTENYNTLFLHCHSKTNLNLTPQLQLNSQLNLLNVSVVNNNRNYDIVDLLKKRLKQNTIKAKQANCLQYFTILITQCKLSEEYSLQFAKYTEYNLSAFDQARKIKRFLKIKTVVIKHVTCSSMKYRTTNQIIGTYLRKNQSRYSAKKNRIWLEERLKGEFLKETVKKTSSCRKISFRNPVRKPKLRKVDPKNLRNKDPKNLRNEDPKNLRNEDPKNLRNKDPKNLRNEDPKNLRKEGPKNLRKEGPEKLKKEDPEKLRKEDPEKLQKEDLQFRECDKVISSQNTVTDDAQKEIFFRTNDRYTVQIQELQEELKLQNLANLSAEFY